MLNRTNWVLMPSLQRKIKTKAEGEQARKELSTGLGRTQLGFQSRIKKNTGSEHNLVQRQG